MFAWLVENKGDPKKAKKQKGELILGKLDDLGRIAKWLVTLVTEGTYS